jgi:3'(2'), 5'-bisphosphate nucleotidase
VLEIAGGAVTTLDGSPLRYNQRSSLLNPHFIAYGDASRRWSSLL